MPKLNSLPKLNDNLSKIAIQKESWMFQYSFRHLECFKSNKSFKLTAFIKFT